MLTKRWQAKKRKADEQIDLLAAEDDQQEVETLLGVIAPPAVSPDAPTAVVGEWVEIHTVVGQGGVLPTHALGGDAGVDLASAEDVVLRPLERKLVRTGLRVAIPEGYVGMVCPRSGLALNNGVTVLNAPGIIDSGYRGEVGVVLVNLSLDKVSFLSGSRIAQLVVVPCALQQWVTTEAENLQVAERGTKGFGSTGV